MSFPTLGFVPLIDRIFAASLTGHDIIVETNFLDLGLRRFPVTFNNEFESVEGFATIRMSYQYDSFTLISDEGNNSRIEDETIYDTMDIDSWSVTSGTDNSSSGCLLNVPTSISVFALSDDDKLPTAIFPASLTSNFLTTAHSFVHTPVNLTHGKLIINPINPLLYAFDQQIFYAPSLSSPSRDARLTVPVATKIILQEDNDEFLLQLVDIDEFVDCVIDDPFYQLWVPHSVLSDFFTHLDDLGFSHDYNPESSWLTRRIVFNVTEDNIDSLPSFQFIVLSGNGQQISIQILGPRDYLGPLSGAERQVMIRAGNPECSLPSRLINRMLVHVDSVNNRIGFGEPLETF